MIIINFVKSNIHFYLHFPYVIVGNCMYLLMIRKDDTPLEKALGSVWAHTSHRKTCKECPENDEYTCLKCNLVSFEITNGFLYYESSWISCWDLTIDKFTFQRSVFIILIISRNVRFLKNIS